MAGHTRETLFSIAEDVSRVMARASKTDTGVYISTPVSYPSGASVVVRIDGDGDAFFVSDSGLGYQESDMIDAGHSFQSVARSIIRDTGVSFDSRSFFVARSSRADLAYVAAAIANFSQRAVIEALIKHEERKADIQKKALVSRLEDVFGIKNVEKDFEIRGASSVEWDVAAKVTSSNVVSIFDYVKPHKNSVVNTVAKFHDIARLPDAPKRIVTVSDKAKMGDLLGLLSQAANVISLAETPNDAIRRLAA
ncbi:MAG: hypothetical protein O9333_10755 [Beijerinckiaceae bacterium]|nr:hypothetical protein [Beijerinckiaceae bacterium]